MRYLVVVFSSLTLVSLLQGFHFGGELHRATAASSPSIDDQVATAGRILASAKVAGCTEFQIADRNRIGSLIKVKCVDGHRHLIRFGAPSMIDGKVVAFD